MEYHKQFLGSKITIGICWLLIGFCAPSALATKLQVQHDPASCILAETPLELVVHVAPEVEISEARLYFKTQPAENFYFIRLQAAASDEFRGILPAPLPDVKKIAYRLLLIDQEGQAVKSPVFTVQVEKKAAACPQAQSADIPATLVVFAEESIPPEVGFSGKFIEWKVTAEDDLPTPYLQQAQEISVTPFSEPSPKKSRLGKKTVIGAGAGLGAAAVAAGIAFGSGSSGGGGSIWDSIDDTTDNVLAELIKSPDLQISCGTVVTNQLFVTNNSAADVSLGTIDYEIVLTKDSPTGSCEPGRTGAFAPNLATVVPSGATLLIREWSNEVNPCSGCPYLSAKCIWKSRYIVHTSAGSAVAFSTFTIEGDLCGTTAAKPLPDKGTQLRGDIEP
ncbi:hypothetical protein U27_04166 [Candidatus Vecturithrix granuli]|uniref:DUF11 domain-containing protein n=1 Tax=Vecturithrix granuli TaxID=1499967 RepID=A0A081BXZ6_VECG1|nr:hypothetical protein U27_04166 [Candidatus Vecturithrix granuli]